MGFGVEMFEEFEGFTFLVPYFWFLVSCFVIFARRYDKATGFGFRTFRSAGDDGGCSVM